MLINQMRLRSEHLRKMLNIRNSFWKIKMKDLQRIWLNARAEKVELQQKLDDAYAQMRELAAKTVESTGGVKILNGQTQQK